MSASEWKSFRIDELCDIRRGASPRPIMDYLCKQGIPWVKISDATSANSRFIESTNEFIKEEGRSKSVFVEAGTLILSNSATPGLPKIMGIDACIHDGWLMFNNFKNIKKEYLYYIGFSFGRVFMKLFLKLNLKKQLFLHSCFLF